MFKKLILIVGGIGSFAYAMEEQQPAGMSVVTKAAISANSQRLVSIALARESCLIEDLYNHDVSAANAVFDREVERHKWSKTLTNNVLNGLYAILNEDVMKAKNAHKERIKRFQTVLLPAYIALARKTGENPARSRLTMYAMGAGFSGLALVSLQDLATSICTGDIVRASVAAVDTALFGHVGFSHLAAGDNYPEYVAKCKEINQKICAQLISFNVAQGSQTDQ